MKKLQKTFEARIKKYMIFSKVQTLYLYPQGKQTSINIIYMIFIQNIHT